MPRARSSFARRRSSTWRELPPSISTSPGASSGAKRAIVSSTNAAGTISHSTRGVASESTSSRGEVVALAPSPASRVAAAGSTSYTQQSCPPASSRRVMFAPIRPSPTIASCMRSSRPDRLRGA
jgi:hypothetical protein